jgi:hypothetical protein
MSEAVTRSELSSAESVTARKLTCGGPVENMEQIHWILLQLACGVEGLPSWFSDMMGHYRSGLLFRNHGKF